MPFSFQLGLLLIGVAISYGFHRFYLSRGWTSSRRLGRDRVTTQPSSAGGISLVSVMTVTLLVSVPFLENDILLDRRGMLFHHGGLLVGLLWVWLVGGLFQPCRRFHAWMLLVNAVGAVWLMVAGYGVDTLQLGETVYHLEWSRYAVSLLWIVALATFFRMFEGLDGLLVVLSVGAVLLILNHLYPDEGYARGLCQALWPALLALLPWRLYPARMELTGSAAYLPGFAIAALTVVSRQKNFTTRTILFPLLVLVAVFAVFGLWVLEQHLFLKQRRR